MAEIQRFLDATWEFSLSGFTSPTQVIILLLLAYAALRAGLKIPGDACKVVAGIGSVLERFWAWAKKPSKTQARLERIEKFLAADFGLDHETPPRK